MLYLTIARDRLASNKGVSHENIEMGYSKNGGSVNHSESNQQMDRRGYDTIIFHFFLA